MKYQPSPRELAAMETCWVTGKYNAALCNCLICRNRKSCKDGIIAPEEGNEEEVNEAMSVKDEDFYDELDEY